MKNRGFIQIPILIAIIVGILVVGGVGYLVGKRVNGSVQVTPQKEMLKNSSEESTTTKIDVDSIYLKEEMARKKQRDEDREKCIANVDQSPCNGSLLTCATIQSARKEEMDRCYFRFPND